MQKIDKIKRIFQKQQEKPVKSRETIEQRGLILLGQLKEIDASLKEFDRLDFLSEAEEQSRIKLAVERERLMAQIQLIFWILEGDE